MSKEEWKAAKAEVEAAQEAGAEPVGEIEKFVRSEAEMYQSVGASSFAVTLTNIAERLAALTALAQEGRT